MKLMEYKIFLRHVEENLVQRGNLKSIFSAHKSNERWYAPDGTELTAGLDVYDHTEKTAKSWRKKNDPNAYFWILKFQAVLRCEFNLPPSSTTREKTQLALTKLLQSAANEYDASYDSLTGLYSRKKFEEEFILEWHNAIKQKLDTSLIEGAQSQKILSVIAIDIDFFKQVNDTHGHLYGDIVLKALASRIENVCLKPESLELKDVSIKPARPSGEEFRIIVSGDCSIDKIKAFAEQIRASIEGVPIPSDSEFEIYRPIVSLPASTNLPPTHERRLTVSIGVALGQPRSFNATSQGQDFPGKQLISDSDVSLYRAKAIGRNRVVVFSEILENCGRVLEHDVDTDIVAIDIGARVGVKVGQEFEVFHPKFSGETAFTINDGRTQKQLGIYPQVSFGRIEVFNVQSDVSFCKASKIHGNGRIPRDSQLKALPLGSVRHLLPASGILNKALVARETLDSRLERSEDQSQSFDVAVIDIRNSEELSERHGVSIPNKALAVMIEALSLLLPRGSFICQNSPTQLAFMIEENQKVVAKSILDELSSRVIETLNADIKIYISSVKNDSIRELNQSQGWSIKARDYIGVAQIVSEVARQKSRELSEIEFRTPSDLLFHKRQALEYGDMERVYAELTLFGFKGAMIENQMALSYWSQANYAKASQFIDSALEYEPSTRAIWLNGCIIKLKNNEKDKALDCFLSYRDRFSDGAAVAEVYSVPISEFLLELVRNSDARVSVNDASSFIESSLAIVGLSDLSRDALMRLKVDLEAYEM